MEKLIITGATGFVGSNLSRYLASDTNYLLHFTDLRTDSGAWMKDDISAVIHLAGKAHDLKKMSRPDQYYQVNFELTKQLYDAFLNSNAEKFIFISSVKAAGDTVRDILTEQVKPDPRTHYGRSKLMAEQYIQTKQLPDGKSYYILRPCMIHGPGNKGNLNLLYQLVAKGIPYPLAAFENRRSFLSIENLCFVIKEILERDDIPGGVYQVADDVPLSTNELIKTLSLALGKKPRLWKMPKFLIEPLARIGDKLRLPFNTERLQKLTENYVVSNQKIKLALRKDLPLSASDGILKTARAFKNA